MRERVGDIFLIVLAFVVPLAGLVLALQQLSLKANRDALRLGLATVAGAIFWTALLL